MKQRGALNWRAIYSLSSTICIMSCFSYTVSVSTATESGFGRMSDSQLSVLRKSVREELLSMGMTDHPQLEWVRQVNSESPESAFEVIDAYVPGPNAESKGPIEVSVLQRKDDDVVSVSIRDRSWFRATGFTTSLQSRLEAVFSAQFPDREIVVNREVLGPLLGP